MISRQFVEKLWMVQGFFIDRFRKVTDFEEVAVRKVDKGRMSGL